MSGSKGGRHSKGKGKSKSKTNEASHKKTEPLNSKSDLAQTSNDKAHGLGDSKGKSLTRRAPDSARDKEIEMEKFLSVKLEDLYTKAKGWLLTSGYGMADVQRAILSKNNRHVNGPKDFLNNILRNTVAFIERKEEAKGEAFKDMKQLFKAVLETMIDSVLHTEPHLQRSDAMWLLLVRSWGSIPSTSMPSRLLSRDEDNNTDNIVDASHGSTSHSCNDASAPDLSSTVEKVQSVVNTESSSKKVGILERINSTPALVSQIIRDIPILRASVQRQIGTTSIKQQDLQNAGSAPREDSDLVDSDILTFLDEACIKRWQENSPNDLKTAFIVDLMESIRNLHNKLTVCKEWAQTKVTDSAKRLSRDLLELNTLKMEKEEMQCMTNERLCAEQSCMLLLKETEQSLRNVNYETNIATDSIERLEASNAQTKANTEAIWLSTSEYETKLNQALNRGIGCMKKLATVEKQTSNLRAQCDEEKQKVLRLQQDVFQAEEEAKEAEMKWREEVIEKERMVALLAEETRMVAAHRANLRAESVRLREELEANRKLKLDELHRLEDELSRERMFQQMSNVSLEGDKFFYNGVEVASLEPRLPIGSSKWICMFCHKNEVSIVLLPCTHQVMCPSCYESCRNWSLRNCPICGAMIQDIIEVYGFSS